MANLSKLKRDEMIAFLDELKKTHSDDASIRAFNMIENHLREKKYGLVWEEHSEEVDELLKENIPVLTADPNRRLCKDANLPWNFIIQGDNLQALYLLEKTHRGKVDCIYIDPPYNNRNKSWKYNNDYVSSTDEYLHSKWLSMMYARLRLAKTLLNPKDSVLICTIDEKEYLHIGCLLEDLFPNAKIQMISSVINHASIARDNEFNRNNEYIYFVMIGDYRIIPLAESKNFLSGDSVHWETLRRHNAKNLRTATKTQFYPIYVEDATKKILKIGDPIPQEVDIKTVPSIAGCTTVFPIRDDGTEMMWGCKKEELQSRLDRGYVKVASFSPKKPQSYSIQYLTSGTIEAIESGEMKVTGYDSQGCIMATYQTARPVLPKTQWDIQSHDARDYGTYALKDIFLKPSFDFPKSLYAVYDTLRYFVETKPNAIILDFFAGSGTTQQAVNLINAKDGGRRRCIMVTNNEISAKEEDELTKQGYKAGDKEWEMMGIANSITWPRTFCSICGVDISGKPLIGDYGVETEVYEEETDASVLSKATGKPIKKTLYKKVKSQMYPELSTIKKADGFKANVKFFKCDWTPRKPEDYLLSNALCLHIREMIELQNAIEIDNVKNVLILNKTDLKKYILNPECYAQIQNVWINQNIILNAEELKLLEAKGYKFIPREFFGQELREAAE